MYIQQKTKSNMFVAYIYIVLAHTHKHTLYIVLAHTQLQTKKALNENVNLCECSKYRDDIY